MVGDDPVARVDVLPADDHAAGQARVVTLEPRFVIVTLSACTRTMLLAAPPQSEPGEQTWFEVAG